MGSGRPMSFLSVWTGTRVAARVACQTRSHVNERSDQEALRRYHNVAYGSSKPLSRVLIDTAKVPRPP